MIVTANLKTGEKPTMEQLERIGHAAGLPVVHDDDSPAYSPEQLSFLYAESRKLNTKQTAVINDLVREKLAVSA